MEWRLLYLRSFPASKIYVYIFESNVQPSRHDNSAESRRRHLIECVLRTIKREPFDHGLHAIRAGELDSVFAIRTASVRPPAHCDALRDERHYVTFTPSVRTRNQGGIALTNRNAERLSRGADDEQLAIVVKPTHERTHRLRVRRGADDDACATQL